MNSYDDYVFFIFDPSRMNKKYGFRTYDDKRGNTVGYEKGGREKDGTPSYKKWSFDRDSRRTIRVHIDEQDNKGLKAVDFLRNSPACAGSPNGQYTANGVQLDYYFKEVNEAGDAKKALDILLVKSKAITKAATVAGQDLIDVCALIGVMNKPEEIMRFRLMDYAQNYPDKLLELVEDPTRQVRSLVRRAIESNVFLKDGPVIKWENKIIGANEDVAVSNLLADKGLLSTVETVVKKLS